MSNQINEAAQQYIAEGSSKVRKWGTVITEANNQLIKSNRTVMNMEKQTALAKVLENTQNRINYELRESTQNTMVGPYKRFAKDIVAGLIPNLISGDIVSMQPLDYKQGVINYVKFTAGSAKGGTASGATMSSTFEYGDITEDYSSNRIVAQKIDSSSISSTTVKLPWFPVLKYVTGVDSSHVQLVISAADGTSATTYLDDGNGGFKSGGSTISGMSIDYDKGVVTLASALTTGQIITATYSFNNEYAPVNVPEVNLSIVGELLTAKSRKLKALWSFDAQYELQKDYGQDIGALLAAQAAGEIAHEIDQEICNALVINAGTSGIQWDAQTPYGVSQAQHFESLLTAFNRGSQAIYQGTKRAVGNFVVVGTNVAAVLASTPSFKPNAMGSVVGPYFMGTWGQYKVYANPFMNADHFVVGYKGANLFESGYVYAPYIPVATTQMLMLSDFQGQQGWATSYATKMLNNNFYASGSISNFANA